MNLNDLNNVLAGFYTSAAHNLQRGLESQRNRLAQQAQENIASRGLFGSGAVDRSAGYNINKQYLDALSAMLGRLEAQKASQLGGIAGESMLAKQRYQQQRNLMELSRKWTTDDALRNIILGGVESVLGMALPPMAFNVGKAIGGPDYLSMLINQYGGGYFPPPLPEDLPPTDEEIQFMIDAGNLPYPNPNTKKTKR